jgi:hypothetical protein
LKEDRQLIQMAAASATLEEAAAILRAGFTILYGMIKPEYRRS